MPVTDHILLVEDNTHARTTLARALEKAGYEVTQADSGEAALQLLEQTSIQSEPPFDVVITDVRMYRVDGLYVLQEARSRIYPPVVILLTGFGSLDNAIEAFRNGAYDYLLKPCDTAELLDCVRRAVQHRKEAWQLSKGFYMLLQGLSQLQGSTFSPDTLFSTPSPTLPPPPTPPPAAPVSPPALPSQHIHIGALSIDTFQRTVTFHGQKLHSTPIEYALLMVLARARGKAIRYQDIVRYTHDQDVTRNEAFLLLKQHISNLRSKIDPAYIRNVRNVGYKLVPPPDSASA